MKPRTIIDGHTDVLLALNQQNRNFWEESQKGHVDYPRMKKANVRAMFFAIWPGTSQYYIQKGTNQLLSLVEEDKNNTILIKNVSDLEKVEKEDKVGAIYHIEGVGGFDSEFYLLNLLYRLGLRSFSITWSDSNLFGSGVSFDSNEPEDKRGITAEGKELIKEANKLGIIIDVSHLSDKSFWDVIDAANKPLIASHSCCRAISPHRRNLTDEMIKALAETNGLIGINFCLSFLREDCAKEPDTPISLIIDHIDHVIDLVGPDHVAFGSDFDGAPISDYLKDVTGFNLLVMELEKRDYSDNDINKICHNNFIRIFKDVWR